MAKRKKPAKKKPASPYYFGDTRGLFFNSHFCEDRLWWPHVCADASYELVWLNNTPFQYGASVDIFDHATGRRIA